MSEEASTLEQRWAALVAALTVTEHTKGLTPTTLIVLAQVIVRGPLKTPVTRLAKELGIGRVMLRKAIRDLEAFEAITTEGEGEDRILKAVVRPWMLELPEAKKYFRCRPDSPPKNRGGGRNGSTPLVDLDPGQKELEEKLYRELLNKLTTVANEAPVSVDNPENRPRVPGSLKSDTP